MSSVAKSQQHTVTYQGSLPVHLLRTRNDEGERCFFIIRSSNSHFSRMIAKQGRERVDINEYGEILASGYGTHPSAQIIGLLKARYNVELPLAKDDEE